MQLTVRLINNRKGRYYKIILHKDLLGDVLVTQAWGGLNNKLGRTESCAFMSEQEAFSYMLEIYEKKKKRGYK